MVDLHGEIEVGGVHIVAVGDAVGEHLAVGLHDSREQFRDLLGRGDVLREGDRPAHRYLTRRESLTVRGLAGTFG